MESNISVMLDCGAPSLYNKLMKGVKNKSRSSYMKDRKQDDFSFIETREYFEYRDAYIQYVKDNWKLLDVYFNLDVIGNAEATFENQKYLERAGLSPVPVYHIGTDYKWLDGYLSDGYPYIAIGGRGMDPTLTIISMLDNMWSNHICNPDGMPMCKVHGFAMTAPLLMTRYPWYSCDSTSWVLYGKYGIILIPKRKDNNYDFLANPWTVSVSSRSSQLDNEFKHFTTMIPSFQEYALRYIDRQGFTMGESSFRRENRRSSKKSYKLKDNEKWANDGEVETIIEPGLINTGYHRDWFNMIYYMELTTALPKWPWAFFPPRENKFTFKGELT
jgi:hypothetical protein